MAQYERKNAWNQNGTFANPDLLWYAIGVGAMQARALADPDSWWFYAAIHGEYVTPDSMAEEGAYPWSKITPAPRVPTAPLPTSQVIGKFWNQCQHQSWYFPPWHRGYLMAIEKQLRVDIVAQGGPATWALPYWDYLGSREQASIPPAFTAPKLPDGSNNPLVVKQRYGPRGDGVIIVPTATSIPVQPSKSHFATPPVTDKCLGNDLYTGSSHETPLPGFGGPLTGFSHGDEENGNLETDPHNNVHGYVGSSSATDDTPGLMSDPGMAALDPIFYLHHCNIDRLWGDLECLRQKHKSRNEELAKRTRSGRPAWVRDARFGRRLLEVCPARRRQPGEVGLHV